MITQSSIARHYSRMEIETSVSPRIIWMLHAKTVQLIRQAQAAQNETQSRKYLNSAQNLLAQLENSLKVTDALSRGLFYLYDYCYCLLESAHTENLTSAINLISILRDTFGVLLKNR